MSIIDSTKLLEKFHTFFAEYKFKELKQIIFSGQEYIEVSYEELSEFDFEIAEQILAYPDDTFTLIEDSLKDFYPPERDYHISFRLTSLPESEHIQIRNIRAEHLGKLVSMEGLIRRKTDVRPRLKYLTYLCENPSCSYADSKLKIPQLDETAKTLKACPKCKSAIELVDKDLVDSQSLILEEISEHLDNSADQPKRIPVLLQEDLVSPFRDSKTNPGSRVKVVGVVKEIPLKTKTGKESINYEIILQVNHLSLTQEDYSEIVISPEDEEQIKELANRENTMEVLTDNLAPSIYGYTRIKESILLQLFGGNGGVKGDGLKSRGNIHILLIGDPGVAKSQLLKSMVNVAPKSAFISGKSSTSAGMVASVIKDDLSGGWALEGGAMVLASGGNLGIDELDKMSEEDSSSLHEALEDGNVTIAKANIKATLRCDTSVLAGANPKFGRFDPHSDIGKQIHFPPALLSRFDLIFVLRDIPNKKKDALISGHILNVRNDTELVKPEFDREFIKKYVAYAKNIKPILSDEAIENIKEFYTNIRNNSVTDDGVNQAVPITARQLEAIMRLSEAYAKIKLSKIVTLEHSKLAIELIMFCLEKVGIDPSTGKLDIDTLITGVTTSSRNKYTIIQNIMEKLDSIHPEIRVEDIVRDAVAFKMDKLEVEKTLDKLKQETVIFEPRRGIYQRL